MSFHFREWSDAHRRVAFCRLIVYTFHGWDARFEEGVDLFNREKFFEAHEVWEDLWHEVRDTDRSFLQALIQVAAAFYHHQSDNLRGMASQLHKAAGKLVQYPATHRGVRNDLLQAALRRWIEAEAGTLRTLSYPRLTTDETRSST